MVDRIIQYIRNIVTGYESRKRRNSSDDSENPKAKIARTSFANMSAVQEDDWHSLSSSSLRRRSGLNSSALGVQPSTNWSKENIIHAIDDDEIPQPRLKNKFVADQFKKSTHQLTSSTPNFQNGLHQNGEDDVVYLKTLRSPKENKFNKNSFEQIRSSSLARNRMTHRFHKQSNGFSSTVDRDIHDRLRATKNALNFKPYKLNRAINTSFQLDEKAKYQKLLCQGGASAFRETFLKYSTPTKLSTSGRGKQIVNLSLEFNRKNEGKTSTQSNKLSTKDTIRKVLENLDNEPIVVKDSDSDVEILPNPPSPKPDFQVERVNSLKTVIDCSELTRFGWLNKLVDLNRGKVEASMQQINTQSEFRKKISAITTEFSARRLEEQMIKCLTIKDIVLPAEVSTDTVFPELTDEEERRVDAALNKRANPNEVVAEKFSISITRRDILTLAGLNWLNDEVINFYMNLIIERGKLKDWPNVYAMNTFFYPKLISGGHASLRRWTRRVDIFSYDMIVVPIHLGVHWCMSVIDFKTKSIQYFDSMGGSNIQCLRALLQYLGEEHLDKKKKDYATSDWVIESMMDIPQQMNGSDCGMFACTFAEFLTRGSRISFTQEDMPYLRRKMVLEILNNELLIT